MTCRDGHPARHPEFGPGNTAHLVHGAQSERMVAVKAAEVHAAITEAAPWLAEPHFAPAVVRYLRAAAREALLHEHIERVAVAKGAGAVASRTWEQATAAARLAAALAADLGLTPTGHARLRALAGSAQVTETTLAEMLARGRAARVGAERRLGVSGPESVAEAPGGRSVAPDARPPLSGAADEPPGTAEVRR